MQPRQFSNINDAIQYLMDHASMQNHVLSTLCHFLDFHGGLDLEALVERFKETDMGAPGPTELLIEFADGLLVDERPRFGVIDGGKKE